MAKKTSLSIKLAQKDGLQVYNKFRKTLYKKIEDGSIDTKNFKGTKKQLLTIYWDYAKENYRKTKKKKSLFDRVFANIDNPDITSKAKKDKEAKDTIKRMRAFEKAFFEDAEKKISPKIKIKKAKSRKTKETPEGNVPTPAVSGVEKTKAEEQKQERKLSDDELEAQRLFDEFNGELYWQVRYFVQKYYDLEIDGYYDLYCVTYSYEDIKNATPVGIEKVDVLNANYVWNDINEVGLLRHKFRINSKDPLGICINHEQKYIILWDDMDENLDNIPPLNIEDYFPQYKKAIAKYEEQKILDDCKKLLEEIESEESRNEENRIIEETKRLERDIERENIIEKLRLSEKKNKKLARENKENKNKIKKLTIANKEQNKKIKDLEKRIAELEKLLKKK